MYVQAVFCAGGAGVDDVAVGVVLAMGVCGCG